MKLIPAMTGNDMKLLNEARALVMSLTKPGRVYQSSDKFWRVLRTANRRMTRRYEVVYNNRQTP